MKMKFTAIITCLAMLLSCLAISSYAKVIDVEIDLGGLFDDEPTDTDTSDDSNSSSESGNSSSDNQESNTGNNGNTGTTTKPSTNTGSSHLNDLVNDAKEKKENEEKEQESKPWVNTFEDVKESDWFYKSVKYTCENGIINGVSESSFAPDANLTRAMLVTVLYRAEGSPRISSDSKFADVTVSDWFGAAVIWASENKIVNGISENEFAPNNNITREQIAAILYRYASSKGYNTEKNDEATKAYDDAAAISSYAVDAMNWSVSTGLITGTSEKTVSPLDNATRAQAATIIMRFLEGNK